MNFAMLRPAANILLARAAHTRPTNFEFYGEFTWGFVSNRTTRQRFYTGSTACFSSRSNSLAAAQSVSAGKGSVPHSNLNKDPKAQKEDVMRRAEKKPPGSEYQSEKTVLKGDATEASKKAEDKGRAQNDGELKHATEKLNESTYGTKDVKDQQADMPNKVKDQLKGQRPI